jgi:hypothetical protein
VDIRSWYELPEEIREFWLAAYNEIQQRMKREEEKRHAGQSW